MPNHQKRPLAGSTYSKTTQLTHLLLIQIKKRQSGSQLEMSGWDKKTTRPIILQAICSSSNITPYHLIFRLYSKKQPISGYKLDNGLFPAIT